MARLARSFAEATHSRLPALVFFTDDERVPDPLPSIRALPRGSLVVLRHRNGAKRRALASALSRIARERGLIWLVADDPRLATEAHAHGVHFPERKLALAAHWRARRARWLITCAVHSLASCLRASRAGVNAIFLAPVFATRSHPGGNVLGPIRVRTIARQFQVPICALGGIDAQTAKRLVGAGLAGLAAIGALAIEGEQR